MGRRSRDQPLDRDHSSGSTMQFHVQDCVSEHLATSKESPGSQAVESEGSYPEEPAKGYAKRLARTSSESGSSPSEISARAKEEEALRWDYGGHQDSSAGTNSQNVPSEPWIADLSDSSHSKVRDARHTQNQQKHVQWSETNEGKVSTSNSQLQPCSGSIRDPLFRGRGQDEVAGKLQLGEPRELKAKGVEQKRIREARTSTTTKAVRPYAATAFVAAVIISCFGRADSELDRLDWLGPRHKVEEHSGQKGNQYQFPFDAELM